MLQEFIRIVLECRPEWWLAENVPGVPSLVIDGYDVQRFEITDLDCGGTQLRSRHVQFGHRDGWIIRPQRRHVSAADKRRAKPAVVGHGDGIGFAERCRRQGVFPQRLPGRTYRAKLQAIGNALPMTMGRVLAAAVTARSPREPDDCPCGCGRHVSVRRDKIAATISCRKRLQRQRDGWHRVVTHR